MKKLRRIVQWIAKRDPRYIGLRLLALLRRYGVGPERAERRIVAGVKALEAWGARPTFPTPGRVVAKNARFARQLQKMGAELAVHGYDHLDFLGLSNREGLEQLSRASKAYRRNGIEVTGFRLPYLSQSEEFLRSIPPRMFEYSSSRAVWWDVIPDRSVGAATAVFENLRRFYRAEPAQETIAVPRTHDNLVEIPVSLPDDIQLYDGFKAGEAGVADAWIDLLRRTHARGEIFVLMFHPELFDRCQVALEGTLKEARLLRPPVWVTQLRDVARWWMEKASFEAKTVADGPDSTVELRCSDRATVLVRGLDLPEASEPWHGTYRRLKGKTLHLSGDRRPFIGVSQDVSEDTISFLQEQGYILDNGAHPEVCGLRLDSATVNSLGSKVGLIDYIESSAAALVRFWRWPNGARSALCLTGDLDALSLRDYASRFFAR